MKCHYNCFMYYHVKKIIRDYNAQGILTFSDCIFDVKSIIVVSKSYSYENFKVFKFGSYYEFSLTNAAFINNKLFLEITIK